MQRQELLCLDGIVRHCKHAVLALQQDSVCALLIELPLELQQDAVCALMIELPLKFLCELQKPTFQLPHVLLATALATVWTHRPKLA